MWHTERQRIRTPNTTRSSDDHRRDTSSVDYRWETHGILLGTHPHGVLSTYPPYMFRLFDVSKGLDTISLKKWSVIQKKSILYPNVEVCEEEITINIPEYVYIHHCSYEYMLSYHKCMLQFWKKVKGWEKKKQTVTQTWRSHVTVTGQRGLRNTQVRSGLRSGFQKQAKNAGQVRSQVRGSQRPKTWPVTY